MQSFAQIHAAQTKALGRYWGSADVATLTEFPDGCAKIVLEWSDGAAVYLCEDSHEEARETLKRLGFM